ncbi:hypothetical protein AAMO2058_001051400 [Amorphochlora amoebiformis]
MVKNTFRYLQKCGHMRSLPAIATCALCIFFSRIGDITTLVKRPQVILGSWRDFGYSRQSELQYSKARGGIWFDDMRKLFYLESTGLFHNGSKFLAPLPSEAKQARLKLVDPSTIIRRDCIHVEGLETLRLEPHDIVRYFKPFGVIAVEYTSNSSCNVRFPDYASCRRALTLAGTRKNVEGGKPVESVIDGESDRNTYLSLLQGAYEEADSKLLNTILNGKGYAHAHGATFASNMTHVSIIEDRVYRHFKMRNESRSEYSREISNPCFRGSIRLMHGSYDGKCRRCFTRQPRQDAESLSEKIHKELKRTGQLPRGDPIPKSNIGREILENMGWREGQGLGKNRDGPTEPVYIKAHRGVGGVGREKYHSREAKRIRTLEKYQQLQAHGSGDTDT